MAKNSLILTAEALRRRSFMRQAGTLGAAGVFGSPVLSALAAEAGHVTLPFENGERDAVDISSRRICVPC